MPSEILDYVRGQVTPHLPAGVDLAPGIPTIKTLARPLAWVEFGEFEPLAEAPASHIACGVDLCIATSRRDLVEGQDEADDLVLGLYRDLLRSGAFYGVTAKKTMFADYIGWRVSTTIALDTTEHSAQAGSGPA